MCTRLAVLALLTSSALATTFTHIELEGKSDFLVALRTVETVRGFIENSAFVSGTQISEAFRTNFLRVGPGTDERLRVLVHSLVFSGGGLYFAVHVGFEDAKYMQYTSGLYLQSTDIFTFLPHENASCPSANITSLCSTTFATNSVGTPVAPISFRGDFDPRTQAWYTSAKAALSPVWSRAFPLPFVNILGRTLSYPIVLNGTFIGVVAVDFCLLGFELFLLAEVADPELLVYLVDDADKLTAANIPSQSVKIVNGTAQQVLAVDSSVELIASTYQIVLQSELNSFASTIITANHSIQVVTFIDTGIYLRVVCVRNVTQDSADSVATRSIGAQVIIALGSIGGVATTLTSLYNFARVRNSKAVMTEGLGVGLLLFAVGSGLCNAATLVLIGSNNRFTCQVRSWLLSLALAVTAAGFVVNATLVRRLSFSKEKPSSRPTTLASVPWAATPPSAMIIAMLVIGHVDPYAPHELYFETGDGVMHSVTCETTTTHPTTAVFALVCAALIAAVLILLATPTPSTEWLSRDARRLMLAAHHSLAMYGLIFGVTALPIAPHSLTITRAILLFWLSLSVQVFSVLFGSSTRSPRSASQKKPRAEPALPVVVFPTDNPTAPDFDPVEMLVV